MRFLLCAIAGILLAACGPAVDDEPEPHPARLPEPVEVILAADGRPDPSILAQVQILHRGNGEEPQTLDPHLSTGVPAANILRDLFEGLTTTAPDGQVVPGAAARWDISHDGLVYTFHLREDVLWSNGQALKAEDFVWSLQRALTPETGATYGRMLAPIAGAEAILAGELPPQELDVAALDERTLQIRLHAPTPYFLGLLTHPIAYPVHRASVETYGSEHARPGRLMSNGAYRLTRWQIRAQVVIEKNEHYHNADQVIIEQVVFLPLEDEATELKRFRAGDLHWTYQVPSNQFQWLQRHMPQVLSVSPQFGTYYLGFNLTRPPFQDNLALRRALSLAVNRELLTERVTRFGEIPSFNFVPAGLPDYTPPEPDYAAWTQQEREAEARRLYRQAGYSESEPLDVELRYNTAEDHRKIVVAVAAMWKQTLGVRTRLVNEEFRVFLQNRAMRRATEVFRAGWRGDYNDPFTFLELQHSGHGGNHTGYHNPAYDRLLEQIAAEHIPARRRNLMVEAERVLLADQVVLPLYTYVSKRLVDPRLAGWENNVMDYHLSRHMYFVREAP